MAIEPELVAVMTKAEAVLGGRLTGEHRRRILAAGRQAAHRADMECWSANGRFLTAEEQAEASRAAATVEMERVVAEAMPVAGGAPAAQPRKVSEPHGTVRLTLAINGTSYSLRRVPCDAHAARSCWSLRKADGTTYHVSEHAHGTDCDCPDFIFHRDGRDIAGCKHVKSLVALGIVEPTTAREVAGEAPFPRRVRDGSGRAPSRAYTAETDGPGLATVGGYPA